MSSMRNAVQRRNFRERGQPEERKKWGLLEKHKDYSARARDYNQKKQRITALKKKALDRNPDEFYFGMLSRRGPSRATGTVNGERGNPVLSQEASRLYKTQDLGYVRTMRNTVAKEVEGLARRAKGIVGGGAKIVFVDDLGEQSERMRRAKAGSGADGDEDGDDAEVDEAVLGRERRMVLKRREKLEARVELARKRLKALADAEEALDLQRLKMAKSTSIGGVNKHGVKYKLRERKR